jgi:hypothetical protein
MAGRTASRRRNPGPARNHLVSSAVLPQHAFRIMELNNEEPGLGGSYRVCRSGRSRNRFPRPAGNARANDAAWRGGHAHGPMLAMMMAMMDTDGDQSLTLAEVQAVHARLFKYADQNSDGKLTAQEIRTFIETGGFETAR